MAATAAQQTNGKTYMPTMFNLDIERLIRDWEKPYEWHVERQTYLGASEVGKVLRLDNPEYGNPVTVWQEKTAPEPIIKPMNDAMLMGLIQEEVVARMFAHSTGLKIQRKNESDVSKAYSWLRASRDRMIVGTPKGPGVLEGKTTNGFYKNTWQNEVPLSYYAQHQIQMHCSGHHWGAIALMTDGRNFEIFWYELDQEFVDAILPPLAHFWNHNVMKKIAPEPQTSEEVVELYPTSNGFTLDVPADSEAAKTIDNLLQVKDTLKELEEQKKTLEEQIKILLGPNEVLTVDGEKAVTWKSNKTSRIDVKRLRNELPELAERYLNVTDQRRFLVK